MNLQPSRQGCLLSGRQASARVAVGRQGGFKRARPVREPARSIELGEQMQSQWKIDVSLHPHA
jgi:hypothetical protein